MDKFATFAGALIADESGVTAIEYGLLAGLLAIGALVGFSTFGSALFDQFEDWIAKVSSVVS